MYRNVGILFDSFVSFSDYWIFLQNHQICDKTFPKFCTKKKRVSQSGHPLEDVFERDYVLDKTTHYY
jgi:hypothetical protein